MLILCVKFTEQGRTHREDHETGILLRDAAAALAVPDALPEYAVRPGGKPYVKDGSFAYSVSHTDGCVVCAVSVQSMQPQTYWPSPCKITNDRIYLLSSEAVCSEIGCDIEAVSEVRSRVTERFFSDSERAAVEASGESGVEFCRIWTRKESRVKSTGEGLAGLRAADTSQPQGFNLYEVWLSHDNKRYICTVTGQ